MKLPTDIAEACKPLFDALPLERAMSTLTAQPPTNLNLVESVLSHTSMSGKTSLAIGIRMYVDDIHGAHALCQDVNTTSVSYWHAIMHRREPDYSNSRYWHRLAAGHPLLTQSPNGIVPQVEAANGKESPELLKLQRQEWLNLFEHCAAIGEN